MDDERPDESFWGYSKVNGTTWREKEMGHPLPWDELKPGTGLHMIREPNNEHDKNAIMLYYKKTHIGYIPKDTAAKLAPIMDDRKLMFWAKINEITGGVEGKEFNGINISIFFQKYEDEIEFKCIGFDGKGCKGTGRGGPYKACSEDTECNGYLEE